MELSANTRDILGKKVKTLRRQGITPVHLYGHSVKPVPLQCDTAKLQRILILTGTTGLIDLKLDKTKKPRNVMIREVQREPRSGELLHVDFYQVRMEEKIRVEVPIVTIGEAPALKIKENFLTHELNTLSVECLPNAIPNRVEIDLSSLTEAEQGMHVADISLDEEITVLTHPEQLVVKISAGFAEKTPEEEARTEIAPEATTTAEDSSSE
ncbi:MAG: 50S ribosomal protein L25 [Dehalococcoidales bacterium]|jgi:large subunit ribosomal protein L25|nr:50S ribosomal protein L25 [Dehalococcoidales bacterium]|tara:strand:- start:420 stop:1052 length:633 start_codon:yes stop_codon:yes gene_type:complete